MPNGTQIDKIDVKILRMLMCDARTSFTKIAQKCKISVAAVGARYKRLWKAGIITGEAMIVNPASLGYKCISNLGIVTDRENEKDVTELLKSKPYISTVFESRVFSVGNVVLIASVVALHSIEDLEKIQEDLASNPMIKSVNTLLWAENLNIDHRENLVIKSTTDENDCVPDKFLSTKEVSIDETDRRIARVLAGHARTPFRKIAGQLGISTKNVIQRYKKLRGTVLTHSTITVNLSKLDYKAMASLRLKITNKSKTTDVVSKLLQIPNVVAIVRYVSGNYDLYAEAVLENFEDYFKMQDTVYRILGVEQVTIQLNPVYPEWPLHYFSALL